jgi:cytoplasmic tRNA 2-thiolation protein 1
MPRKPCESCKSAPATLKRPRNGALMCNACFFAAFEDEVHRTIIDNKLFEAGDVVASGASGGKDSTVLMHLIKTLNDRHKYGIKLILVSVDEGIAGYRDDSLKTVHRNSSFYDLPLHIVSYKELYGWSMDEIVAAIGPKNNCTFCGVFRRQALDRAAATVGATKLITGHNADDTAETILMNVLRADTPRLARCVAVSTDSDGMTPRVKPLKNAYEKEIVLYAHFKQLDYFTTECTYSKEAFRGNARVLLKDLEALRPAAIADTIYSGEHLPIAVEQTNTANPAKPCERCGYITSQKLCRACVLLDSLNRGRPQVGLRTSQGLGDAKKNAPSAAPARKSPRSEAADACAGDAKA